MSCVLLQVRKFSSEKAASEKAADLSLEVAAEKAAPPRGAAEATAVASVGVTHHMTWRSMK